MLVINYKCEEGLMQWQEEREAIQEQLAMETSGAVPKTHLFALATWIEEEKAKAVIAIYRNPAFEEGVFLVGGFDCVDEKNGKEFLSAVIKLLKNKGAKTILGPMLGSTWYPYTFQSDGNLLLPTEQKHPNWYPKLWQEVGFSINKEFYHFSLGNIPEIQLDNELSKLKAGGVEIKSKSAYVAEDLVSKLYSFLHVSFGNAYLFSPIDWPEFKQLFQPLCEAKHQGLLWVAERKEQIVAMVFGMRSPSATPAYIMKTLARHPANEYKSLGKIIGLYFMKECKQMGAEELIFANAREDNFSVFRAKEQGAKKINTRSLFKLQLS